MDETVKISEATQWGLAGTRWARFLSRGAVALTIVLIGSSVALSQLNPTPSPPKSETSVNVPLPAQDSSAVVPPAEKSTQDTGSTRPAYLTSVHGLQGVLAETDDGATVAAQSVDDKFNPASSIKLATTLVAFKPCGPNYRFVNSLWTNGKLDAMTGTLHGDLILA